MTKKGDRKSSKKTPKLSHASKRPSVNVAGIHVEKALIENFVSLQKVMTNMIVSFDELSGKISKLLDLFELSAKALAEKNFNFDKGSKKEQEISDKLEGLLEQNKIIARGLTLLHEGPQVQQQQPPQQQKPSQPQQKQMQPPQSGQKKTTDLSEYQKSISFKP